MIITEEKYNEELTRCVLPFIRLNFEDGYMKSADGTRIHYGYVTTPVSKAAIDRKSTRLNSSHSV